MLEIIVVDFLSGWLEIQEIGFACVANKVSFVSYFIYINYMVSHVFKQLLYSLGLIFCFVDAEKQMGIFHVSCAGSRCYDNYWSSHPYKYATYGLYAF